LLASGIRRKTVLAWVGKSTGGARVTRDRLLRAPQRIVGGVLSRYEPAWKRWAVVLTLGIACVAAAIVTKARLDATTRSYSDTHGETIVRYALKSRILGRELDETAIVPAGGGVRPLLVLLHGRHDPSRLGWLIPVQSGSESMLSDALFAGLARLGKRAPVVVMLNGGGHSYYHDRRDGRWASMVLDEAIPDAVRRFGTEMGRIAIGGVSMGGYGALHLAALRPEEFCAVGGHSAALWESSGASAPGAFDDAADFARNDVFAAARKGQFDRLPVWIDGGTKDPFRDADAAFASLLLHRGIRVAYHVWPGAHTKSYWQAHMADYLRFYASALAACRG
jgi:S-formylglutathione hydrolase FrmB